MGSSAAHPARRRVLARWRRHDPALAAAARTLEPMPQFPCGAPARDSHFVTLSRSIVFQQLAGAAARTIWGRYAALTPGPRAPRPEEFLALPEAQVRAVGLSAAKFAAIQDLAGRVAAGRLKLQGLGRLPDEEVIERLTEVRGIGVWTAQMFLMFKLGRDDVMPSADLGVQEGLRLLDQADARPSARELEARAAAWAPWRTHAAWAMWRLVDARRAQAAAD